MTQSLWEHATVQMPPDLALLPVLLNELSSRFGGELLAILPMVVGGGVVTGNGQPQVRPLWTLVLRFPAGQKEAALAFVRGQPEPQAPAGEDAAGPQALTLEGV